MLKRLTKDDSELIREAWEWTFTSPAWFQDMDKVFSQGTAENLIEQLDDWRKVFIGVLDPELAAIIIIEWKAEGLFEGHLMTRRRVNVQIIEAAINQVLHDSVEFGMREAFVWIAEKNLGVRKLCATLGMRPNGVAMYKGSYRGRVIKWQRYSITREQLLIDKAA